jgi:predicted Fe-Mo cluster-binding NifX family protein
MTAQEIRIAFPTEDGFKISRHFGKAPYFVIVSLLADGTLQKEQRHRDHWHGQHESGLIQFADSPQPAQDAPEVTRIIGAGLLAGSEDCQVLIAGGMGQAAYDRAAEQGLQVILTNEKEIDKAVASYRSGNLTSDLRRVHRH